jgi:hypothetical protein
MSNRLFVGLGSCVVLLVAQIVAAQDFISGKFYRFEVVGRAGLSDITNPLTTGPSINELGQVAFPGSFSASQNAVYVSDLGTPTPRKMSQANNLSFTSGLKLTDSQHYIALDISIATDIDGFRQNYLRDFNAPPPGPATNILVAGASNPIFNDFRQIFFPASLNNSGQPVFSVLRQVGTALESRLVTGVRPAFN